MLYILLAYLMLFAALSNAVCLHNVFFPLIFANAFAFMLYLGLLTHSLFILGFTLHLAQLFYYVRFSQFYVHTIFFIERAVCSLET